MRPEDGILSALKDISTTNFLLELNQIVHLQGHTYRVQTHPPLFVKWISFDDDYGLNEMRVNQEILVKNKIPAPRLLHVIKHETAYVVVWEWVEGSDLRFQNRNLLPQFFARLGEFHREMQREGQFFVPGIRQPFLSLEDFLYEGMAKYYSFLSAGDYKKFSKALSVLNFGFKTIVHGDLHPGNLRYSKEGMHFVDWGYSLPSINLFDLDYIHSVPLPAVDENAWWLITPEEATEVLPTYYQSCGLAGLDFEHIQLAIMLGNEFHSHVNSLKRNDLSGMSACRQNIDYLLDLL